MRSSLPSLRASLPRRALRVAAALSLRVVARFAPTVADRCASSRLARYLAKGQELVVRRVGTTLRLNLADNVQRTLYFTGTYEPAVLKWLRQELRPGDFVVDIGGHIGVHTIVAARRLRQLGAGRVYAFEPAPDVAEVLRHATRNLPVIVIEAALGSASGVVHLRADPTFDVSDASTRSRFNEGKVVHTVAQVPFDVWAQQAALLRLDVIKIDVEGSEHDVLLGMEGSLRRHKPRSVLIELQPRRLAQASRTKEELTSLLAECSYVVVARLPGDNFVFRRTPETP